MAEKVYPSDMSDSQWKLIRPLIPAGKTGGRPRNVDMRGIINAILYIVRGGISWRMLPKEYGPWQTVYGYFRKFQREGIWQKIHGTLCKKVRRKAGKKRAQLARRAGKVFYLKHLHASSLILWVSKAKTFYLNGNV